MSDEGGSTLTIAAVVVAATGFALYYQKRRNDEMSSDSNKSSPKTSVKSINSPASPITLVDETEKYPLKLMSKEIVTHNTRKFRFALPSPNHVLGLPVGQFVYLSAKINGKLVVRPYTPISTEEDKGFVELMVKVYFRGVDPKFPEGGKMSQYLDQMSVGDTIDFRGPSGLITYKGHGLFVWRKDKKSPAKERHFKRISMIAGGSGVTPILQVITDILKNPEDKTEIRMIFANRSEDDILCRSHFDELTKVNGDRFRVRYVVSKAPADWKHSTGRVDMEMIQSYLHPAGPDHCVLLCGPPGLINQACLPHLEKLGHDSDTTLTF